MANLNNDMNDVWTSLIKSITSLITTQGPLAYIWIGAFLLFVVAIGVTGYLVIKRFAKPAGDSQIDTVKHELLLEFTKIATKLDMAIERKSPFLENDQVDSVLALFQRCLILVCLEDLETGFQPDFRANPELFMSDLHVSIVNSINDLCKILFQIPNTKEAICSRDQMVADLAVIIDEQREFYQSGERRGFRNRVIAKIKSVSDEWKTR